MVSDVTLVELDTVMLSFSVPSSDTCQKKKKIYLKFVYELVVVSLHQSWCRASCSAWSLRAWSSQTWPTLRSWVLRSGLSRCRSPYLRRLIDDGLGRYNRDLCGGGGGGGAATG